MAQTFATQVQAVHVIQRLVNKLDSSWLHACVQIRYITVSQILSQIAIAMFQITLVTMPQSQYVVIEHVVTMPRFPTFDIFQMHPMLPSAKNLYGKTLDFVPRGLQKQSFILCICYSRFSSVHLPSACFFLVHSRNNHPFTIRFFFFFFFSLLLVYFSRVTIIHLFASHDSQT